MAVDSALVLQSRPLALEVHRILRDLDPARFRQSFEAAIRARIANVAEQLRRVGERAPVPERDDLAAALVSVADALRDGLPADPLPPDRVTEAWAQFRSRVGVAYEALSLRLRARAVELPSLRPTNHARSLVHLGLGVAALVLAEHVLDDRLRALLPTVFAAIVWTLEIVRRRSTHTNRVLLRWFGSLAHPRETHHVNSSTWYATSLAILGLAFPLPLCAVAVAVVAFADPSASLVGRRFGRTRLVGERSLEGTLAFAVVGTVAGFAALRLWHASSIASGSAFVVAAAAATGAAIIELVSGPVDDNLSVPIGAAAIGWLALVCL